MWGGVYSQNHDDDKDSLETCCRMIGQQLSKLEYYRHEIEHETSGVCVCVCGYSY